MNRKWSIYILVIVLAIFLLIISCVTNDNQADETVPIDHAISEAASNIEQRLDQGTKIALLNFNSPSEQFSEYILEELSDKLVNSGKLIVVDRAELDVIRQEERFQLSGEVSDESAQAIGRKLGAQVIVSGSLGSTGDTYRFRIKTLGVETAVVVASFAVDLRSNENKVRSLLVGTKPIVEVTENRQTVTLAQQQIIANKSVSHPSQQVAPSYKIGNIGPAGGIVFYDKGNSSGGWRYLEVAPIETDRVDNNTFSSNLSFASITDRAFGSGLNNTRVYLEKLRLSKITGNTAPLFCDTLVHNGYSDWYLPSLDEVLRMYTILRDDRNAGFSKAKYWTSTCYPNGSNYPGAAYFVNFSNGQAGIGEFNGMRIRACRRF